MHLAKFLRPRAWKALAAEFLSRKILATRLSGRVLLNGVLLNVQP